MACVESVYVRRPLTYFSMTKCVFIGLLGVFFARHLYRKRQTDKPKTELGVYCRPGGGWSRCPTLKTSFSQSYQRFGSLKRRRLHVPMTAMM